MNSNQKAVAKTFTWRFTATLTTVIIAWFITGSVEAGLAIGGIEFFAKMFLYYVHERLWER